MQPPVALTLAGSDPCGGAGIGADLKAFAAAGVWGAAVITAVTAQDSRSLLGSWPLAPEIVAAQIDSVFGDLDVAALKIGMLGTRAIVLTVAERLAAHGARAVVLDPVLASSSGAELLASDAREALCELLLPQALVLTPNLPEAALLLGWELERVLAERLGAARALLALGPRAVLLKGGHDAGSRCVDLLVQGQDVLELDGERIDTRNTHGTGCALSAALAAQLARGATLPDAAAAAKAYVSAALRRSRTWRMGAGAGPLGHGTEGIQD